jgi:hypothetical protein
MRKEEDVMQVKPWRVTWYDAAGEIESADFVHENDARRKMDRVKEDRLGRSVKLWRMRQTDEAAAAGLVHDDWDLIEE